MNHVVCILLVRTSCCREWLSRKICRAPIVFVAVCLLAKSFAFFNPAEAAKHETCSLHGSEINRLNGPALVKASEACVDAGKKLEAILLRNIGEVRWMTDLAVLFAATDSDEIKSKNFNALNKGYGDILSLQDPELNADLFTRFENWTPVFDENYNPGWDDKSLISSNGYEYLISQEKDYRLAILGNQANLIAQDEFKEVTLEMRAVFKRNGNRVNGGTEDYYRLKSLQKRDAAIRKQVQKQLPKVFYPHPREFTPDPTTKHEVLYSGYNGPNFGTTKVFSNYAELEKSWLRYALTGNQMAGILNDIDFEDKQIIAVAYGKRTNVTAKPHVYRSSYNSISNKYSVLWGLGIMEKGCDQPPADSYPFAVIAIDRIPANARKWEAFKTFNAGCKPPLSSSPSYKHKFKFIPLGK